MRKILNRKQVLYYLNDYEVRNIAKYFLDEGNLLKIENIVDMRFFSVMPSLFTKGMSSFIDNIVNCVNNGVIKKEMMYIYSDKEGFKEYDKYNL